MCRYPDEQKLHLPWVGEILELKEGQVHVQWVDGTTSFIYPDEAWKIDPDDYYQDEDEEEEWEDEEDEEEDEEEEEGEEEATGAYCFIKTYS